VIGVVNGKRAEEFKLEIHKLRYKNGDRVSGSYVEYLLRYWQSVKEKYAGNYERALNFLDKAIKIGEEMEKPGIITFTPWYTIDILKTRRSLYLAYQNLSQGNFHGAAQNFRDYIGLNKLHFNNFENSRKYNYLLVVKDSCELLAKNDYKLEDLLGADALLQFTKQNERPDLYQISALVYSLIALTLSGISNNSILESIKLNFVSRITNEDLGKELEKGIRIQRSAYELEWMVRLPSPIVNLYDSCVYFYANCLTGYEHAAFREFYTLIENYLRPINEFNAKMLWGNKWRTRLSDLNDGKPYELFSLGHLVNSLEHLKNNNAEHCKKLPKDLIDQLKFHVSIRNDTTHDMPQSVPDTNIVEVASGIMFGLLESFPICVKIISARKAPWYEVEILWEQIPKKANLLFNTELTVNQCYYTEPNAHIDKYNIYPNVMIPIEEGTKKILIK